MSPLQPHYQRAIVVATAIMADIIALSSSRSFYQARCAAIEGGVVHDALPRTGLDWGEGDVLQVELILRAEPGDQSAKAHRRIELERAAAALNAPTKCAAASFIRAVDGSTRTTTIGLFLLLLLGQDIVVQVWRRDGRPMAAFSSFFMQCPSFLDHQHRLEHHWRSARQALGSRRLLFGDLASITSYLIFDSWQDLLQTLGFGKPPPPRPP
jgi:hypothetical protein